MLVAGILLVVILGGCSSLSVRAPRGMFISTGDYVPGIQTLGIIQEKERVWAPLFIVDINKVHQKLYEKLIDKAQNLGADGVTNIKFSWKPAPLTYPALFILTGVFDFYIEGVAIKER